jgi:hypothetical protein
MRTLMAVAGGDDGTGRVPGGPDGDVPVVEKGILGQAAAQVLVRVVEVLEERGEVGVPVLGDGGGDAVEDLLREPVGLSSVCSRNGSSDATKATLAIRPEPYRPR